MNQNALENQDVNHWNYDLLEKINSIEKDDMNDWTTKVLGLLLDDVDQNIINALKEYKNKEAKE